ncbi:hypothetical protein [Ignatzschineria cameli]|uniref:hypothetical protein n=1 Tax=Ignatzschineria cameli TaxID=2182793 RepID=UPI0010583481|nr:hypothetical protein [Ignatzschineria cameli]
MFSPFCFDESFLRRFVEGRELTISFFLPVHARCLASMMPTAGAVFLEERDSKDRQRSALFVLLNSDQLFL